MKQIACNWGLPSFTWLLASCWLRAREAERNIVGTILHNFTTPGHRIRFEPARTQPKQRWVALMRCILQSKCYTQKSRSVNIINMAAVILLKYSTRESRRHAHISQQQNSTDETAVMLYLLLCRRHPPLLVL